MFTSVDYTIRDANVDNDHYLVMAHILANLIVNKTRGTCLQRINTQKLQESYSSLKVWMEYLRTVSKRNNIKKVAEEILRLKGPPRRSE